MINSSRRSLLIACLLGSFATTLGAQESNTPAAESAPAEKATQSKPGAQYVRLNKDDEEHPIALQTSIVSFQSTDDAEVVVDLVGAIHVGEKEYYEELNRRFKDYDAVLYELVAPEGTTIPKGGVEPSTSVSYMQTGMTKALGLAYQLNAIDYTRGNFVHADMTPEEFANSMKEREESLGKMFFRALGQSLVKQHQQDGSADIRMLTALMSGHDRELKLKRVMAEQFADLDGAMLVFEGPNGSTLVTERNKKALSVLRRELKNGKKKVGIFYGAGHMKDMGERLISEFQMTRQSSAWLSAWDLQEITTAGDK